MGLVEGLLQFEGAGQIGVQLFLKLQPHIQFMMASQTYPMWSFKYFGSYSILQEVKSENYTLVIPVKLYVQTVFLCIVVETIGKKQHSVWVFPSV
jgi:hypothetical protein